MLEPLIICNNNFKSQIFLLKNYKPVWNVQERTAPHWRAGKLRNLPRDAELNGMPSLLYRGATIYFSLGILSFATGVVFFAHHIVFQRTEEYWLSQLMLVRKELECEYWSTIF